MLVLGAPNLTRNESCEMMVYNYTSFSEGIEKIYIVPPVIDRDGSFDYDMYYANWLLTDDNVFAEFMKLIYALYEGKNVYLCTNDLMENVSESLLKFIQQRYGYNGNIIHDPEDFGYIEEGVFTLEGLSNLDMDKNRYALILASRGNYQKEVNSYDYKSMG